MKTQHALLLAVVLCAWSDGVRADHAVRVSPLHDAPSALAQHDSQSRTLVFDSAAYREMKQHDHIVLTNFAMPGNGNPEVSLDLHAINIFAEDATLVSAHIENGKVIERPLARPDVLLLEGSVEGEANSQVFLSLSPYGQHGFIRRGESLSIISTGRGQNTTAVIADRSAFAPGMDKPATFMCEAEQLPENQKFAAPQQSLGGGIAGAPPCRQIQIAVETDAEYLANLFSGNQQAAAAYVATLMGASSSIYIEDVNTRFQITYVRLWTGPSDPWNATGTSAQLVQYRDYWNANMSAVPRTIGHFLSGRALGGGVAYLEALCHGTLGYGLSANLAGSFPLPLQDHHDDNWDIMVVSHEIGHNFGSPHTHSYVPPIDGCGNGDCTDANLGTIMSYCHQCPGGMSNIVVDLHPIVSAHILDYLDGLGDCNLDGVGMHPHAAPDFATIGIGGQITLDVLGNDVAANCKAIELYNFNAASNGGGTITLSPGSGPEGRDQLIYQAAPSFLGVDRFSYNIQDSEKLFGGALVSIEIIEVDPASHPSQTQAGLKAKYYALNDPQSLPDFSTLSPTLAETIDDVNFGSTGGNFAGSGMSDNVGAVMTGYVSIPASSLYTFFLESDDGSKLYVDDTLLLDNDGLHGMLEKSGNAALAAGLHRLRIEFFERTGGAGLIARWSSSGLAKQVIPAEALFGAIPADPNESGSVDVDDLLIVINGWGTCPGPIASCDGDVNGDGTIDVDDLLAVINAWG